ncbi:hypothetical protein EXIGLDRAFT_839860 [Exidia glandulosa HHB12029]|uniref:F-box domain-containing protein n=1 Tax=Exidia glandulosa HHB12029 TaxID=1314781 RepID=A0A165ESK2_EXIGL|nr:hypothetical protein EXIGLDRAFT_839860 [Exidia glandulosa HHB12029]
MSQPDALDALGALSLEDDSDSEVKRVVEPDSTTIIPEDVLFEVVSLVAHRGDLAVLARSSRLLYGIAQRHLYHSIYWDRYDHRAVIDELADRYLNASKYSLSCVRRVVVCFRDFAGPSFGRLLERLENVEALAFNSILKDIPRPRIAAEPLRCFPWANTLKRFRTRYSVFLREVLLGILRNAPMLEALGIADWPATDDVEELRRELYLSCSDEETDSTSGGDSLRVAGAAPARSDVLTRLRIIEAPSNLCQILVPGRPVWSLHITSQATPELLRAAQLSTERITTLKLHYDEGHDSDLIATAFPHVTRFVVDSVMPKTLVEWSKGNSIPPAWSSMKNVTTFEVDAYHAFGLGHTSIWSYPDIDQVVRDVWPGLRCFKVYRLGFLEMYCLCYSSDGQDTYCRPLDDFSPGATYTRHESCSCITV